MKKYIIILLALTIKINAQDVSGAVAGAISTTLHTPIYASPPQSHKKVYTLIPKEIKVNNTFIKYNNVEYQVYKTKDKKFYFYPKKNKRMYFKIE